MTTRGRGYTILEVLIFIAVSAFIFVAAMAAINGRQQQVQFSQSVREFDAKINDVINDVTTGYYPTNETISCSVNLIDPTARPVLSSAGAGGNDGLGTNSDCLYVGKAFHFVPAGETDKETKFYIYNLVGRRYSTDTNTVKSINETKPIAVATTGTTFTDPSELAGLRFGVEVTKVFDSGNEYGIVAVLSSFEGSRPSASVSSSQSASIGGIYSDVGELNITKQSAITLINMMNTEFMGNNGYINTGSDGGVVICLKDQDNRKASVTVGAAGTFGTQLQFDDYNTGCD